MKIESLLMYDCPDGAVCLSCSCAGEDGVCFPGERLQAEVASLQAQLDEAREALERLCERNVTGTVPISAVRDVLSRLQEAA